MTWLDIVITAVIALSALYSVFRGLAREVLSLLAWILSFWLASRYSYGLVDYLERYIPYEDVRFVLAFLLLFCAVLLAGMLLNRILAKLIRVSRLNATDRALGAVFGALRGVLVVTLLIMATAMTPLAEADAWRGSLMTEHFSTFAAWMVDWLGETDGVVPGL